MGLSLNIDRSSTAVIELLPDAEFCRKKLARRLLFDRSTSDEYERSILSKLKQQCGAQFTSKMEGMVTDMALAKEKQIDFDEHVKENPQANSGIGLSVTFLTTGFWPSYKTSDLNLPAEMAKCVETFKQYYDTKNKKRKLNWIYSLGSSCVLLCLDSYRLTVLSH